MKSKKCYYCGEEKPLSEMEKDKRLSDGVARRCYQCKREYYKNNKDSHRNRKLKKLYGITLDEYNEMFVEQRGCCAACGKHDSEQQASLAVDHDHETGEVRSLLCSNCNAALGLLEEDEEKILGLLAYMKRYK